jgi:AAA15 family ATPase/GTPase
LGPFTCIAGTNAIGKSNFFDAIVFLSHLYDQTILQPAKSIRSENQRHSNVKDIFFRSGNTHLNRMKFEIDLIVPESAEDDLGQVAKATMYEFKIHT